MYVILVRCLLSLIYFYISNRKSLFSSDSFNEFWISIVLVEKNMWITKLYIYYELYLLLRVINLSADDSNGYMVRRQD